MDRVDLDKLQACDRADERGVCRDEDGETCAMCQAWLDGQDRYFRARWESASLLNDQDLIDAGRGHLVRPR